MNPTDTSPGCAFRKVLIVDDDPVLSAIAEMFFTKKGAQEVLTATNGHHGLEIVDRPNGGIDFILCDLNMPEMDGIQFLRHLKDRDYRGQIAILSGEQATVVKVAESLAAAHNLHVAGTLSKPLKVNELEQLLDRLNKPAERVASATPVLATVHDLRHAIASREVVPFYQPKVEVRTGAVAGAEALARWLHPKLGVIGPGFFIPMAEQNNLLDALTDRMICAAIEDMALWRRHDFAPRISINLGAGAFDRIEFPDEMAARVGAAGLDCRSFVFEITERQLVARTAAASEILARLRLMGFGLSIDDFGTGYSNIELLRELPFSELKIDQSFVREACHDRFARTTVETCAVFARQLDLTLVAEGVETEEDWNYVAQAGIDEVQGYYIAKPMPGTDFADWAADYEGRRRSIRKRNTVSSAGARAAPIP